MRESHSPRPVGIEGEGEGPDATDEQRARMQADNLIRDAEASKARILEVPGNAQISLDFQFVHSALVDSDFQLVASHVDEVTKRKIENCEYVDFAKLIPRGRQSSEGDARMQLVNKNGQAWYVPASEVDNPQISGLARWE